MFIDLVKKSRTNRSFNEERTITRDELLSLVDTARFSPAAMNLQPLKYRLVYEKDELDKMLAITSWGGALPQMKLPPENKAPTGYIVICHDTAITSPNSFFLIDVGIVAQTIMLAAADMGLSGCILGSASEENLKKALALPENMKPQLVLALGEGVEDIRLIEATDGKTKYFRDENNVHYVPKRPLDEIIIK